ncbi:MAG: ABC transporter permease [bacterium]
MRLTALVSLFSHRRLLWQMTLRDLRGKYAGSLMGLFWTVINPLLLLAVFTFIFAVVFKAKFGEDVSVGISSLYILCGILPWLALADGVGRSGSVVLENKNLVTRALFPLPALPAFPALSALLGQLAGFVILFFLAGFLVHPPGLPLLFFPVLLVLQLLFTWGLCLFFSAVSVYLRDVIHVLPVLLLVWLYATPVFYPASMVPPRFRLIVYLNPMAHFLRAYRSIILEGTWPWVPTISLIIVFTAISFLVGALVFGRLSPGMADRL